MITETQPPPTALSESASLFLQEVQSDPATILRGIQGEAAALQESKPDDDAPYSAQLEWGLRKR